MTAHGEVVRSYEPEEMEPTKKQRFCALVHGSARLDDHAIIGDVTHERTVQRRVRQRTHELWMGTFTSGRARRSDSNQDLAQHSLGKGGCDMAIDRLD